jgi:ATP-binding cassette subfamily B multidrug efflux pump
MFKLCKFLKPYRIPILTVLGLVFLHSLAELYLPTLMADIVDTGIVNGDTAYIVRVGGIMLGVAAIGAVCALLTGFFSARTAAGFGRDLREKVFSRVHDFSLPEFDRFGTPSLITRTTNDITQVQMAVLMALRIFVSAPVMCIGGIIMAVSLDVTLSWVLAAALPVLAVAILIITRESLPLFKAMQAKIDRINQVLREKLSGIRVIRAFNRIEYEKARFHEANLDLTNAAIRVNRIMACIMPLMMLVMNLTTIAIIWVGGIRIDQGQMQVGALMAFLQYAMQIMFSLMMVSFLFIMIPRASASAERINQVLDTEPEIKDRGQVRATGRGRGIIEFQDVSFSYPGAGQHVLSNISFRAEPGQTTAIIGGTGSGKSTLVNLIPRFYDVSSGRILLDGVDIRDLPQADLRAKIGFVPQKSILFSGTIADNIRYGKPDAAEEELRQAAAAAQATEFIAQMNDGFMTMIAQGGTNVSGGQKQRLAIARALVRRPEVYIFDDSFSALDFQTDARLRAALKQATTEATVIIVAQRVSTVMGADRIIVLDDGRIVGMGKHQELLETCSVYREIIASQLAGEEIA